MLITSNAISHKQHWQRQRELEEQQKRDLFKLLHAENSVAPPFQLKICAYQVDVNELFVIGCDVSGISESPVISIDKSSNRFK